MLAFGLLLGARGLAAFMYSIVRMRVLTQLSQAKENNRVKEIWRTKMLLLSQMAKLLPAYSASRL